MLGIPIRSLSKIFLLVIGALLIADMIASDENDEKEEKKSSDDSDDAEGSDDAAEAKAEKAEADADDDKDVEGDAVVED
jgi:cytoskeletal protein RodZ